MGRKQGPRKGSMQIWPRKRSNDFLPRVNWKPFVSTSHPASTTSKKTNFLGFIGYKVGMASAFVKDNTADSMTKNKRIIIPVTILECPPMKILSIRFHKNKKVLKEIWNDNLDKELKRIIRMPKTKANTKELLEKVKPEEFDDVEVIVYSQPNKIKLKKTPDLAELALSGKKEEKLEFIKANLGKEISVNEVFSREMLDVRGLTRGKGFQGAVKRFGIRLRNHKAEKGQRRVGSIGGWHPIGVRFTVPRAGQLGLFSRVTYNNPLVAVKKYSESETIAKRVFEHYGLINGDYVVIAGSVQGPQKRQLLMTPALRPTKRQNKRNYELVELR